MFFSIVAQANFVDNNLHSNVTIASAVTIVETDPVSFGNFIVEMPGGGDASIILTPAGGRTSYNGASTTIALASGGYGTSTYGAAASRCQYDAGIASTRHFDNKVAKAYRVRFNDGDRTSDGNVAMEIVIDKIRLRYNTEKHQYRVSRGGAKTFFS